MIKVIIERQFRKMEGIKAESLLLEIRSKALRAPGYIGGETLSSVYDPSVLVTISTWADEASWKAWASSRERQQIMTKIAPLMVSPEKISVCRVVSGSGT
ncbi:MAG: antibiotic biosynthesis monooxygenase family protein [Dehalococcoidia bacterium]